MYCENCGNNNNGSYGSGRFCSPVCSRSFSTKAKRSEINNMVSDKLKGREPSSKGKTGVFSKETLEKMSNSHKEYFKNNPGESSRRNSRPCSAEKKNKLSEANKGKTGGYRERGGRGKQGWYRGIFCNSSWELAYVIYCKETGKKIERNKEGFDYIYENTAYKFYPDFIVDENYVEIKGYYDKRVREKINQFPHKIDLIDKKNIYFYIQYASERYGNFTDMYE